MNKPHKREWEMLFDIAEEDRAAFKALIKTPSISLSVCCFHAQQAVEKYMKAVLSKHKIAFPFTHDLLELYDLLLAFPVIFPVSRDDLKKLNPFAVKQRYDRLPEIHITREEAEEIVDSIAHWCKKQIHD